MRRFSPVPRAWSLVTAILAAASLFAFAFSAEAGVGILGGKITADDTHLPLAGIRVVIRPAQPKSGIDARTVRTDRKGEFLLTNVPVGWYDVQPLTNAYTSVTRGADILEGQEARLDISMSPGHPSLDVYAHRHSYLPEDDPRIGLHGFRQGDALSMRLYRMDPEFALQNGNELRGALDPVSASGRRGTFHLLNTQHLTLVKQWSHAVKSRDAEGVFYDYEHLGKLPLGLYLLNARGAKSEGVAWLLVTDLALITKNAGSTLTAYATDLKNGQPLAGARVSVYRDDKVDATAETDAHGLARIHLGGREGQSALLARKGNSLALMTVWGERSEHPDHFRVYTYTDRPVYRPGHKVRFKGVVRRLQSSGYALPSPQSLEVLVTDDQETEIARREVRMNERGTFAGDFEIPAAAHGGAYTMQVDIQGEHHTDTLAVASYRKPEWRVDVKFPKPHYVRGDEAQADLHAEYYYGAPVSGAKVRWTVFRSPHFSWWDGEGEDADFYSPDDDEEDTSGGHYGEVVGDGEGTTDEGGNLRVGFATTKPNEHGFTADYDYRVQAEVSDLSGKEVSGEGQVRVSAGELTLDARSSGYVAQPGDTVTVTGRVRDPEGKPVPDVAVTATASMFVWDGRRGHDDVVAKQAGKSDAQGNAVFKFPVSRTGSVNIKLATKDRRGNPVEGTTYVWVTTQEGGDFQANVPALSVILDKKQYRIGDTAQVLINTDRPGATALVSVEAESVLELKQVVLKNRSNVLRIPVKSGWEPNVFVTACFVKNREFVHNQVKLQVDPEKHRMKVTIDADRPQYHPRDTATFHVHTTTMQGKPMPAEVSFGVVDEAIYAIRPERKRGLWEEFYPRRRNEVQTQFSDPEIYLGDADKDGGSTEIRRNFPDTCYWDPFVRTDASGNATVTVRLPDNLTSWRATAVGITAETVVGRATQNIKVAKELTLRLQTPRSINEGDKLTLSAVAHNYTPGPLDVSVQLSATGLEVKGAARQKVHVAPGGAEKVTWEALARTSGKATVTATANAGSWSDGMQMTLPVRSFARNDLVYRTGAVSETAAREEFDVDPAARTGELELRVSPTLAGTLLGSLDYLATYPHGCAEQTMSSFLPNVVLLQTLRGMNLRRPELENRLPEMTRAGLLRLYHYQHPEGGWGWWEYDETDPWMTAYVLYGLTQAKQAGVKVNPRIYQNGLEAAARLAKGDTGENNRRAESHGHNYGPDEAQFLAYSLAIAGDAKSALELLERFKSDPDKLQRRSVAYRLLALAATGGASNRGDVQALMQYLWAAGEEAGGMTSWTERAKRDYWDLPQPVETTALVLKAALAVDPSDSRLSGVVRWLLLHRKGSKWESTRDTAFILLALSDYLKATGELRPDYHLSVKLNGEEIIAHDIKPGDALQPEEVLHIPKQKLISRNVLEISRTGTGTAYYAMQMTQEIPVPAFAPDSTVPGLKVSREYYKLESRRDDAGRITTLPQKDPTRTLKAGERFLVRVTLHADQPMQYLMLEDPLPSGCEVIDRGDVDREDWGVWWSHMDVRDDRVNFFISNLEPGTHSIDYYIRPEMSGQVRVLPSVLSDMYVPAAHAGTAESRLEVQR